MKRTEIILPKEVYLIGESILNSMDYEENEELKNLVYTSYMRCVFEYAFNGEEPTEEETEKIYFPFFKTAKLCIDRINA